MKQLALYHMLLGILVMNGGGIVTDLCAAEARQELASVQFGQRRPFSFYYPYSYQFYYPRPHYQTGKSCYRGYHNGNYFYYCETD